MLKIFIYTTLLILSFCKTTENEYVGITLAKSKVNSFPKFVSAGKSRYTMEIKDEYIIGTSESNRVLFFKTLGSSPGLTNNKVLANVTSGLERLVNSESIIKDPDIAAASINAIDSAKADSIFITDIKEEQTGVPFLYSSTKHTVRGKPMFLKSLEMVPPTIDPKLVMEKTFASDLLDEELKLLKIQFETQYNTKLPVNPQPTPKESKQSATVEDDASRSNANMSIDEQMLNWKPGTKFDLSLNSNFNEDVVLKNGKTLSNVKVVVTSDSVIVVTKDGKSTVYKKSEITSVKKK